MLNFAIFGCGRISKKHAELLGNNKIPGAKPLQRLYTGTDTYWKTVGFLAEKAKYSAAFRKAGIQNIDGITDDLVRAGIAKRQKNQLISDIDGLDVLAGDIVENLKLYKIA